MRFSFVASEWRTLFCLSRGDRCRVRGISAKRDYARIPVLAKTGIRRAPTSQCSTIVSPVAASLGTPATAPRQDLPSRLPRCRRRGSELQAHDAKLCALSHRLPTGISAVCASIAPKLDETRATAPVPHPVTVPLAFAAALFVNAAPVTLAEAAAGVGCTRREATWDLLVKSQKRALLGGILNGRL